MSDKKILFVALWLICICLLGGFLISYGSSWGLPSAERNAMYFSHPDQIDQALQNISPDMVENSLEKWPMRGQGIRAQFPRYLFNPIRSYHPDEYLFFKCLSNMKPKQFDFDPKNLAWPALPYYLTGAALEFSSRINWIKVTKDMAYYFHHPEEFAKFYLAGRMMCLLSAVVTFVLLFGAGNKFFGTQTGLLSALLCAVSAVFIIQAHFLSGYILAIMWMTGVLWVLGHVVETGGRKVYLWAGIFIGLATGSRYMGIIMVLPLIVTFLVRKNWKAEIPYLLGSLCVAFLAFFIAAPFSVLHLRELYASYQHISGVMELKTSVFDQGAYRFFVRPWMFFWTGVGPALTVFIIMGIGMSLKNITPKKMILWAWILPFYFLMSLSPTQLSLYYIFLLVPVLVLASVGFNQAVLASKGFVKTTLFLILSLTVVFSLMYAGMYVHLLAKPDPRTEAGDWIQKEIPIETSIGVNTIPWQFYTPPLSFEQNIQVIKFDELSDLSLNERPDFCVISSSEAEIKLKLNSESLHTLMQDNQYQLKKVFARYPTIFGKKIVMKEIFRPLNWYIMPEVRIYQKVPTN